MGLFVCVLLLIIMFSMHKLQNKATEAPMLVKYIINPSILSDTIIIQ